MSTFDEREKSFEAKYRNDQEKLFRIVSRRNRLLGFWVAEQFGMSETDAEQYAKEIVIADFEEPGDADVVRKVLADFSERGLAMDEARLRIEMTRLMDDAEREISEDR